MPRPWAFVSGVPLPDPPFDSHLACVPIALLPLVIGALEARAAAYVFAEGRAFDGIQLIRSLQVSLITGCQVAEAVDRVYRLLDTQLAGTEYTETEIDGVITVLPPLPAAPAAPLRSLHSRLERLEYLLDNALNGAEHLPDFGDTDGVRDLLRELVIAVQQAGPLDDDQLDRLTSLVGLLS